MNKGATLLLGCLKREAEEFKASRLRAYETAEWEASLETADTHGMKPVVYDVIKNYRAQLNLSADALDKLRGSYYSAAARNMRLYRQLLDIITVFNDHKVEVILLKGAHLAELVYGNIALRSMCDIDLLVRPDDLRQAHQLLVCNGYGFSKSDSLSNTKHLSPYRKESGVSLEIHFHITDPPYADRIDIEQVRRRATVRNIQGVEVLTLCPEDLYLHLCLHSAVQHGFEMGLVSVLDIAFLIERCSAEIGKRQKEHALLKQPAYA